MYLSTDANYCPTTMFTNNHKDLHIYQNNTPVPPLNISMCVTSNLLNNWHILLLTSPCLLFFVVLFPDVNTEVIDQQQRLSDKLSNYAGARALRKAILNNKRRIKKRPFPGTPKLQTLGIIYLSFRHTYYSYVCNFQMRTVQTVV
jgi:hypothetical protein